MDITKQIKAKALELGFESCGISKARELTKEKLFLEKWLKNGLHASMSYMANHKEKRVNPQKLVPGAKSVISVLLNYMPVVKQKKNNAPKVAKYAYGKDYHFVLKEKLKALLNYINEELKPCSGRVFTDSAPVLERAWAEKAGLGWIGKNTNLIVPHKGSFFFIGELIIDLDLEYDEPISDLCGSCTKCVQACPTNALVVPYLLDSKRCISFQTIENKEEIPENLIGKFENWVFGCDICQDVCPWNRYAEPTKSTEFSPNPKFLELDAEGWRNMDRDTFNEIFRKSAVKRTKFTGIKRNLRFLDGEGG